MLGLDQTPFFKCLFRHSFVPNNDLNCRWNHCSNCGKKTLKPVVGLICPTEYYFHQWLALYAQDGFFYVFLDEREEVNDYLHFYTTFVPRNDWTSYPVKPARRWKGWLPSKIYE